MLIVVTKLFFFLFFFCLTAIFPVSTRYPVFVDSHFWSGFKIRILDEVFYAFFQGWRQRHGLPELDLNTKQQQLVSWRNALEVDRMLAVMERGEFQSQVFRREMATQKYRGIDEAKKADPQLTGV